MKSLTLLVLVFATITQAHAQEIAIEANRVESTELQLLGKGVINRRTGESLALACVTENCSLVKTVYFDPTTGSAYWAGVEIQVTSDGTPPTKKQVKAVLKEISKKFQKQRDSHKSDAVWYLQVAGSFSVLIGMFKVAFMVGPAVAFPAGMLIAGPLFLLMLEPEFYGSSPVVAKYNSQTGWNWSSKPKKISRRRFQLLELAHDLPITNPAQGNKPQN